MGYPHSLDCNLVREPEHRFGGSWSSEKLQIVAAYFQAYRNVLKNTPFRVIYIDAFAGSGSIYQVGSEDPRQLSFPEFQTEDVERFIEGSTVRALQVEPPFHEYLFIEKNPGRARDLESLREKFPDSGDVIRVLRSDANEALLTICRETNWKRTRAVLFLDPYGMQVKWSTVAEIAKTGAIDIWYLFPSGIGVQRLLRKDGNLPREWEEKLDEIFGASDWREEFYKLSSQQSLFCLEPGKLKIASLDSIEGYFVKRLQSIFPVVAKKPARLMNNNGKVLYSLCFAAGNEKGGKIALKIASHLLKI